MNKERRKTIAQPDLFPDRPSRVSGAAYQEPVQKMHEFNFWDLATMESRPDWIMLEGLDTLSNHGVTRASDLLRGIPTIVRR